MPNLSIPEITPTMLDNFEDLASWTSASAPGARVKIAHDIGHTGKGLRVEFDFRGGGSYVIVRKSFALTLPAHYTFSFFVRGKAPQNHFEFKLVDPTGENVWWYRRRNFSFPKDWQRITVRNYHLEFAWGKAGGGMPEQVGAIEFAISVGTGGQGSVWIDDLRFEPREPPTPYDLTPVVHASSSRPGHEPAEVLRTKPATSWKSDPTPGPQWLLIDFLRNCEFGGLVIDWDSRDFANSYRVLVSLDNENWQLVHTETEGRNGPSYISMPDAELRFLKLELARSRRGLGYGIRRINTIPCEFVASPNYYFKAIAKEARRGLYPKYLCDEQTYWTVVGTGNDTKQALLNEEGMLEVDRGGFSIEPFIYARGKLITWSDVDTHQELEQGYLPIPSVRWQQGGLELKITALATGDPGNSAVYLQYRIQCTGSEPETLSLFLAVRPFQVNPPWQSVNLIGGYAPVHELRFKGHTVLVNRDQAIISLTAPDAFGALAFDQGSVMEHLLQDRVPAQTSVSDPVRGASGALQFKLLLSPGAKKDIYLAIPLHDSHTEAPSIDTVPHPGELWDRQVAAAKRCWETKLNRVGIQLPPACNAITNTLKTTLAYILINRDGPALQPGARCYARSWIRDGAGSAAALLAMGCTDEIRDFLTWFARFQSPDGAIPCCVDRHGVDRIVEHDSHGQFIYAVMEFYRYTGDLDFPSKMWPYVVKTIEYIESLHQSRRTEYYKTEDRLHFYGLLPESVSHEGYMGRPVHSYWDDFWALRGLKDAASMAVVMGDIERAARFASIRDEFSHDLHASIARALKRHNIAYLPGSADLGDLDPSATAIALDPCDEQDKLPEAALAYTFTDYYTRLVKRRAGELDWNDCTPYELRNVGALMRLGLRKEALEVLEFFMGQRRPRSWNQWAEVIWRDPKTPRFIGDMPHTWVGSDFIRAVRSLFAFEREADRALIIGVGLPPECLEGDGVRIAGLPTHYGSLSYTLRRQAPNEISVSLRGNFANPPARIILAPPLASPLKAVTVNGKAIATFDEKTATLDQVPSDVVLSYLGTDL